MYKVILCLLVGSMLSGCAQYRWKKDGSTKNEFERDKYECQSEASRLYPAQYIRDDYVLSPATTNCTNWGYSINCTTQPPVTLESTKDMNASNRNESMKQCLLARGYELVRVK